MATINSLADLSQQYKLRVELLTLKNGDSLYMRELTGAVVSELARRAPHIIEHVDGSKVTDSGTNRIDMAFVVANSFCDVDGKLLAGGSGRSNGEKQLGKLPASVLKQMFEFALRISDLNDDDDEELSEKKPDS